jgi:enoyl-CoA hydratase
VGDVVTDRRDSVLVITLNRPEVRNALNRSVALGVKAAVDELESSASIRAAVLTGAGGVFSAGMDLKAFADGEQPMLPGLGLCGITEAPPSKPLVAAVEGWALGGGFELVLACDLVVAGRSARFGLPEVKRGLVAGAGGAYLLPQRVGHVLAMEILLTGEPVDAPRAGQLGLINSVVDDGQALDAALALATQIAALAPLSTVATKRIATQAHEWSKAEAWSGTARVAEQINNSLDAAEGARAFAEKRPPVWRGR